ncbi:NDP-hexose 2,3-dehydratase family protein [Actinomadura chokoriensis]|uniref:NDP-hexose 2,3-dehydratase family protein n=1 Tax=Actinomadura chokoriensis TaxID=454156 RepID=A0ABV4R4V2_9ACTN
MGEPAAATADSALTRRLVRSALAVDGVLTPVDDFWPWYADRRDRLWQEVERIPFTGLGEWEFAPGTGNLVHDSGRFFSVEGLDVRLDRGPVRAWSQPIIHQPEIGILGILVKDFDGVLHCLMQAKSEPGNRNGVQISPTVQATMSNYQRVHGGRPVPYLDVFRDAAPPQVLADALQSEQGSWFYRKRNRNMIVEVTDEVEVGEDFRWLTIGQLHRFLTIDNLVNMEARTVLSCLPMYGDGLDDLAEAGGDGWADALVRSLSGAYGGPHSDRGVLSRITGSRAGRRPSAELIPLDGVRNWRRTPDAISHEDGRYFSVVAVRVEAAGREVRRWAQPLVRPQGQGVAAWLVRRVDGVLHVLVHARVEPGYLDVTELAPTVQCVPDDHAHLPPADRPPFLDDVLGAPADRIHFDTVLSEEGGRFHHAENRYLIIEAGDGAAAEPPDGYWWVSLFQLTWLVQHSHYLNVQARTLLACLRGRW